jgi:hypothetical protein
MTEILLIRHFLAGMRRRTHAVCCPATPLPHTHPGH